MKRNSVIFLGLLGVLLVLGSQAMPAQTINISLPKFGEKDYLWILYKGTQKDTVLHGRLDSNGKASISLPQKDAGYRGLTSFQLSKGVGLDLIVAGENFTVTSSSETPNLDNIVFTGSPENTFLIQQYQEQRKLKGRLSLLQGLQTVYKSNEPFYLQATAELKKVTLTDSLQQKTIKASTLYAAQFLQMSEYLDGVANYWKKNPEEIERLKRGAIHRINSDLYNSSFWKHTIDYWAIMYREKVKNDSVFVADAITLLQNNSESPQVLNELGNNLVEICEQNDLEKPKMLLALAIFKSGKLPKPTGSLARVSTAFSASPGNIAPALVLGDGSKLSDSTSPQSVIVFYETGCDHCEELIHKLKAHCQEIESKGFRIITISSDFDAAVFKYGSSSFPWKDKLCDFKGLEGENFKSYGIIGTPTVFTINEKGIITGRHAKLEHTGLISQ